MFEILSFISIFKKKIIIIMNMSMNAIFINKVLGSFIGEHPNFYVTIIMWRYDKVMLLGVESCDN